MWSMYLLFLWFLFAFSSHWPARQQIHLNHRKGPLPLSRLSNFLTLLPQGKWERWEREKCLGFLDWSKTTKCFLRTQKRQNTFLLFCCLCCLCRCLAYDKTVPSILFFLSLRDTERPFFWTLFFMCTPRVVWKTKWNSCLRPWPKMGYFPIQRMILNRSPQMWYEEERRRESSARQPMLSFRLRLLCFLFFFQCAGEMKKRICEGLACLVAMKGLEKQDIS